MSEFHKLVKTIATLFAIGLAVLIISSIASTILRIPDYIFNRNESGIEVTEVIDKADKLEYSETDEEVDDMKNNNITKREAISEVKKIQIYHTVGKLTVQESANQEFLVEAVNVDEDFSIEKKENGVLIIREKQKNVNFLGLNNKERRITISIPKGIVIEEFYLSAGVGDIRIDDIQVNIFEVEAGAGNIKGSNLVAEQFKIECGVGNTSFREVLLGTTNIEGGVGNIDIRGKIHGNIDVETGVGNVNLQLDGSIEDYKISGNKGLGSIKINREKINNYNGKNSEYKVNVEGGIGNIDIVIE